MHSFKNVFSSFQAQILKGSVLREEGESWRGKKRKKKKKKKKKNSRAWWWREGDTHASSPSSPSLARSLCGSERGSLCAAETARIRTKPDERQSACKLCRRACRGRSSSGRQRDSRGRKTHRGSASSATPRRAERGLPRCIPPRSRAPDGTGSISAACRFGTSSQRTSRRMRSRR